ncbi:MAG TPA: hypothetical protein VGE27_03700 [Gemmatimonas sp.]|uniref:hypothetical protein n=1 Tax=Gemmatimonas sp. TaxID=1962908 RepID=UPI002ED829A1
MSQLSSTKELPTSASHCHAEFLRDVFDPIGDYPIGLVIDQLTQYGLETKTYRALAGDGFDYVRLVRDGAAAPRLTSKLN